MRILFQGESFKDFLTVTLKVNIVNYVFVLRSKEVCCIHGSMCESFLRVSASFSDQRLESSVNNPSSFMEVFSSSMKHV